MLKKDVLRHYGIFFAGVSYMYGCVDDCVYVREGTRDKFCFGPGDLQTRCEESGGIYSEY